MTLVLRREVEKWKQRLQYYRREQQKSDQDANVEAIPPKPLNKRREERTDRPETKRPRRPHRCLRYFLFGFGWSLTVVGIFVSIIWPSIVNQFLQSTLALRPFSTVYEKWVETPIPIYFKMYMFNWTNPETSLRGPDKPAFQQLGPYVFLKHQVKRNVQWNDNDTVTYIIEDQYPYFIPEMSNGSLSDRVTNINIIPLIIGWYCRDLTWFQKSLVNSFMAATGASLVKTDTVGNMLFDGSNDPILSILYKFKPFIPNLPLQNKFGYLYGQNGTTTTDGTYTMQTGVHDINSLGRATAWNYANQTMLSGECGRVEGFFNELYPPDTYYQDKLVMFGFPLCSSGPVYRESYSSISGIPTAVFIGKADSFSNEKECFCPTDAACPPSGAHDVSQCQGVPFLVSWPHFYLADAVYRDSIVGMNPDPAQHQLRFEVAKVTAATLTGRFKMQFNFPMLPTGTEDMGLFKGVQKIVVPLFWTSQDADLSQSMMDEMYWLVLGVQWGRLVTFLFGLVGFSLVVTGGVMKYRGHFRHQYNTDT